MRSVGHYDAGCIVLLTVMMLIVVLLAVMMLLVVLIAVVRLV